MIAGFDAAVRGLAVGESVTVRLEPGQAYGERRDDLIIDVPKSQAPAGLVVGSSVQIEGRRGVILEITDEAVRVDTNHPLAGQALTFEIQLVSIE
jgi:FKBP-type peptidyl-prolyl cis-trans isomerase 2